MTYLLYEFYCLSNFPIGSATTSNMYASFKKLERADLARIVEKWVGGSAKLRISKSEFLN